MSEFFDMTDISREHEHMARAHATQMELTEGTLSMASLVIVAVSVVVLFWVLG